MTNISKLLLTTVLGTTLSIASLSATDEVNKIQAFENIPTQILSLQDLNLVGEYFPNKGNPLKDIGKGTPTLDIGLPTILTCWICGSNNL